MSALLGLPAELKQEIVGYVSSASDRRALLLVCSELHATTAPELYRSITISLERLDFCPDSFVSYNKNLAHTKYLEIEAGRSPSDESEALEGVILAFPRDSLRRIDIKTFARLPLDLTQRIHMRQRNLRNYWVHRRSPGASIKGLPQADELQNVVVLTLVLGNPADCERSRHVLRQIPGLQDLSIVFTLGGSVLQNDAGAALSILLADWIHPGSTRPKLTLKRLNLRLMGDHCHVIGSFLARSIEITNLATLELTECSGADVLLTEFSQAGIGLSKFVLDSTDDSSAILEDFLRRNDDLRELWISQGELAEERGGTFWQAIRRHGTSLRILFLGEGLLCHPDQIGVFVEYRLKDIQDLCTQCPQLEQFALTLPLEREDPDANSTKQPYDYTDHVESVIEALKPLKSLVSLRLLVYPQCLDEELFMREEDEDGTMHICEDVELVPLLGTQMQMIANLAFSTLRESCPHLVALQIDALESWERSVTTSEEVERFGYMRDIETDADGYSKMVGRLIEQHMLKDEEPNSEIFRTKW